MYRQDQQKKPRLVDARKRHFGGAAAFKPIEYPFRLNFYTTPPTAEVTLEEFEQWAIDRLRGARHPSKSNPIDVGEPLTITSSR
jgi:DNA primase large subunit